MSFVKIKDQIVKGGKNKPLLATNFRVKLHDDDIDTKSFAPLFKAEDTASGNEGYLYGYMSTWGNADSVGDVVRKGAFTKTLKERRPRVLWQHNAYEPIGVIKEAYEDDKGLFAVIALNLDTQRGLETYNLYKSGAMDSFSIGIQLEKYNLIEGLNGKSAYEILETKLWEVSAVTFPANEMAVVTAVKEKYEETVAKNTSEVIESLDNVESIDDLIDALQQIKADEERMLEEFFFQKSDPVDTDADVAARIEEAIAANTAVANSEVQESKSIEEKLAEILLNL